MWGVSIWSTLSAILFSECSPGECLSGTLCPPFCSVSVLLGSVYMVHSVRHSVQCVVFSWGGSIWHTQSAFVFIDWCSPGECLSGTLCPPFCSVSGVLLGSVYLEHSVRHSVQWVFSWGLSIWNTLSAILFSECSLGECLSGTLCPPFCSVSVLLGSVCLEHSVRHSVQWVFSSSISYTLPPCLLQPVICSLSSGPSPWNSLCNSELSWIIN
jgi:hypothetical protein